MLSFFRDVRKKAKWARRAKKAELRREKMASFGPYAMGLLVQAKHGIFAVDPEDDSVSKKLLRTGNYNETELDLVRSLIPPNSDVLMIGTHIGALTVPLSKYCKKLVAIEANPNTFKYLNANLMLNGCSNVKSYNFAAGEISGKIPFILSRDNSGGSKRMPKVLDLAYVYDKPEIVEVDVEPLDKALVTEKFDLIFMDIEGSEYFAFKGMQNILSESKYLIVEFAPHHLRNVAGVTVDKFLQELSPHFEWMYIPKRNSLVSKQEISKVVTAMYSADESHDGLVFLKSPLSKAMEACDREGAN
ncbi:FkbM family methyltransferase [Glaciimonas immobilis]|uniref:FkbM family methyltransferase n=1 Tax=Glaciimonas immobilis TaxID=728004 RepID=A0A840RWP3_9BURK|nr:FkbM family methyltransferase [Glaciimonas immobilis]KAF3996276.1 FkbM family methyltransferase [Glaciimonas immobilis]MBB5202305.1 FkbM family methyltransferase [Glaciimonas immobilis]